MEKKCIPINKAEIWLTIFSLSVTIIACTFLGGDLLDILLKKISHGDVSGSLSQLVFITTITFLLYGSFVYHFARLGQLQRRQAHRPESRETLESVYEKRAPSLAILVPAYKENPAVITKTLLSAALLDYPSKQVVLLIDNPPVPKDRNDRELLEKTRQLPQKIHSILDVPASHFRNAFNAFVYRRAHDNINIRQELAQLARLYTEAAEWMESLSEQFPVTNHEDKWFIEEVLHTPAQTHQEKAEKLEIMATEEQAQTTGQYLYREYCRISRLFQVEIKSFERKCYANLSHEPNKAMNLNSYLGLMGEAATEEASTDGLHLKTGDKSGKGRYFPNADYVITLDADSLLLSDYALHLTAVMQAPGNERLAVAQTPYSAFPDAPTLLERIAGATTDIQYLVHQGFTHFNATFWVGANALLRKAALDDIVTTDNERGYEVHKYIQDRTVIEDTESSVDLADRGWHLYNYPERLAYSATPPDFGSLLIQRRRWANGGLIILPKFIRFIRSHLETPSRFMHALLGGHYLTSLAGANLAILIILLWPFEEAMRTQWLPLATVPYFILYARDLVQTGYRASDVFRVSALSLLLVPVNLGGVFKSVQQILTGKRTPFGRTPKVSDRTATPFAYLVAVYGFMAYCMISLALDVQADRWMHAIFSAITGSILLYATTRFIGVRESIDDLLLALRSNKDAHIELQPANPMVAATQEMEPGRAAN